MIIHTGKPRHAYRCCRTGSMLIEMTVALGLLAAIGIMMLKGSINVMAPRQWIIHQNITDAYLTYEEAYARRVSFDEFTADDSDWTVYDASGTTPPPSTQVEIGKTPGGNALTGSLIRIRIADENNPDYDTNGDTIYNADNLAEMETWKLQSHLTYQINGTTKK